ncbi:MAG: hypothetical protein K2Q09_09765, partial [Phycisphaerales bacterium]|nr:hypothetical protein [Phycisphaerales bacterium]
GRLPLVRLTWTGGEAFAWSEQQARAVCEQKKLRFVDMAVEESSANQTPDAAAAAVAPVGAAATVRELHENKELERLFEQIAGAGLSIDDWGLTQEEDASGARLATRYAWELSDRQPEAAAEASETESEADARREHESDAAAYAASLTHEGAPEGDQPASAAAPKLIEAPNLPSVLGTLLQVGRRGVEVKRFKGLGEMDAEELWETTMDPKARSMMRVTWDAAGEAERLFTILMGEDVEQRRKYIEEHALEVRNLDV